MTVRLHSISRSGFRGKTRRSQRRENEQIDCAASVQTYKDESRTLVERLELRSASGGDGSGQLTGEEAGPAFVTVEDDYLVVAFRNACLEARGDRTERFGG